MDINGEEARTANKMFLQWCRDELVLSFIFVQHFVSWDRTRLRKGTTAETQTLWATRRTTLTERASTEIEVRILNDEV